MKMLTHPMDFLSMEVFKGCSHSIRLSESYIFKFLLVALTGSIEIIGQMGNNSFPVKKQLKTTMLYAKIMVLN